jgi:hypothetical protein
MRNPRLPPEFYGDCGTAPPTSHQDIKTLWYELVEQYSPAKTTVQCDKLLALAGIAEGFQRVTGDTYLAGLWKESLQNDLLWTSGLTSENAETFRTFRDRSIPTWSWAAWAGIKFMYPLNSPSDNWHLNAQFLEASVEILDEKLPFGRVAGGLLIIKGPLRVLSVGEVREQFKIDKRRWRGHEVYPDFDWFNKTSKDSLPDSASVTLLSIKNHNLQDENHHRVEFDTQDRGLILRTTGPGEYERLGMYTYGRPSVKGTAVVGFVPDWSEDFIESTVRIR